MTPDPKPKRRVRLTPHHYRKQRAAFLAAHVLCECGCGRRAESVHHVIGGNGKEDVPEAWLAMAGDGVRLCHGAFTSRMRVWDEGVYIDPLEVAWGLRETMETTRKDCLEYVLAAKGVDGLERIYPRRPT